MIVRRSQCEGLPTCYARPLVARTANIFTRSRARFRNPNLVASLATRAAVEKLVLGMQFGYSLTSAGILAKTAYVLR
jgi:hypothetical protein